MNTMTVHKRKTSFKLASLQTGVQVTLRTALYNTSTDDGTAIRIGAFPDRASHSGIPLNPSIFRLAFRNPAVVLSTGMKQFGERS